ncbi:Methylmalonic aciduria type A protein, mitochondrial [Galdieria sulphuraria]|nr:Methylmalonic aciduria type A protein, mitochondrial [Galdieria sulphuraria]
MLRLVGGQIWCYLKERYRNVVPHYSCRWLSSTLELRTDNTKLDLEQFSRDVVAGKTYALARAITLAESRKLEHSQLAAELLDRCIALRVNIYRVTWLSYNQRLEQEGDKTRMNKLATEPNAYVRPSPSGGTWGGLARHTDEVITLCETAGYEVILVETVGVGQSEAAVADAVDMLILLVSPGAGDELQGSKKGILELADIVVVNRADGSTKLMAAKTRQEYLSAIELQQPRLSFWKTPVLLCSCIEKKMEPNAAQEMSSEDHWSTSSPILSPVDIWKEATQFHQLITQNGVLTAERGKQRSRWMWSVIRESIVPRMKRQTSIQKELPNLEQQLAKGAISPRKAALNLLDIIFQSYSSSSKN